MKYVLEQDAADKTNGMTLAEVRDFVGEAIEQGADPNTLLKVSSGFRRQIKGLEMTYDVSKAVGRAGGAG